MRQTPLTLVIRWSSERIRINPNWWQRLVEAAAEGAILEKLLLKAAVSEGLQTSEKELKDVVKRTKKLMSEGKYEEMLDKRKSSEDEYREFLRQRMLIEKYKKKLFENIVIEESQVKEYYMDTRTPLTCRKAFVWS